ncbi:MAG: aspartate-semialdehyde dehydrogenase [Anaerolineae bacterium]|nr:aspartate-semialdehyde dehydrogenase [Anaerolineae bacterium]
MMIDVAILGATGAVGQRFIQLLQAHPWFRVAEVVASERSSGKHYAEAVRWVLDGEIPPTVAELVVLELTDSLASPIVFSALPAQAALEIEARLAAEGHFVFSNASAYRMAPDVPLLLPEVNAEHLRLVGRQQAERGWKGGLVTNSNCTAAPVVMALAPLRHLVPQRLHVVSMQAVSGAGYPGVPSLDILDNVIPYIGGEEEKLAEEPRKMLGTYQDGEILPLEMTISASCNRVPVVDSHLVSIAMNFQNPVGLESVQAAWEHFEAPANVRTLPSAPNPVLVVTDAPDRPQPRRDRLTGGGMATVIGRLRAAAALDGIQFMALTHNTIRGAAGCSILNAELLVSEGYLSGTKAPSAIAVR